MIAGIDMMRDGRRLRKKKSCAMKGHTGEIKKCRLSNDWNMIHFHCLDLMPNANVTNSYTSAEDNKIENLMRLLIIIILHPMLGVKYFWVPILLVSSGLIFWMKMALIDCLTMKVKHCRQYFYAPNKKMVYVISEGPFLPASTVFVYVKNACGVIQRIKKWFHSMKSKIVRWGHSILCQNIIICSLSSMSQVRKE